MAVAIRGTSSAAIGINSLVLTIPAAVQAGDTLLIMAGVGDGDVVWPDLSGWTRIERRSRDASTTGMSAALYKRVAASGDAGTTVTLTASTTAHSAGMVIALSGADVINPVHAWAGFTENAASPVNSHALPAVTTTIDQCLIVTGILGKDSATTLWTIPADYPKAVDIYFAQSGRTTGAIGTKAAAPPGTYSPGAATQDGASKYAFAWTLAIAPYTAVQTSRPISDITATSTAGVPTPGAGSGIYADVAANDDSHYAQLSNGGVYETKFAALVDPGADTGHTITYRLRFSGGATSGSATVIIKQGSTIIATFTDTAAGSFTDITHTLTTAQAAAITDYADLRVQFTATVA